MHQLPSVARMQEILKPTSVNKFCTQESLTVSVFQKVIGKRQKLFALGFAGERLVAAQVLEDQEGVNCPVYVDTMADDANTLYGGIPERLYILENDTVSYAGGLGPWFYSVDEVEDWIKSHKEKLE